MHDSLCLRRSLSRLHRKHAAKAGLCNPWSVKTTILKVGPQNHSFGTQFRDGSMHTHTQIYTYIYTYGPRGLAFLRSNPCRRLSRIFQSTPAQIHKLSNIVSAPFTPSSFYRSTCLQLFYSPRTSAEVATDVQILKCLPVLPETLNPKP